MADDDAMNVDAMLDDALDGKPILNTSVASDSYESSKENDKDKRSNSDKKRNRSRSRSRDRKKDEKSRKRSSSRDKKKKRSRSRERKRSKSRERKRSRSKDRKRSRSRSPRDRDRRRSRRSPSPRRRSRSRDRPRVLDHRDSRRSPRRSPPRGRLPGPERRDVMPFTARNSPPRGANLELSPEERDQRTLFILQIARLTRPRDLEEFFSSVGAVRDVRIITDSRTGRSKGIAYVEFWEEESMALGLALNGQKLLGAPLVIQRTCAERNRAANNTATVGSALGFGPAPNKGPCKLQLSNLHTNITENMLDSIFAAFGRIEGIKLQKDQAGNSIGSAIVTFSKSEDGAKAMEQLNGFELAGNSLRVSIIDEEEESIRQRSLDDISDDKQGMALGQGGRIQLMAKLAQGTGIELPANTQQALRQQEQQDPSIPAIATQCFMLSNMFDPAVETENGWDEDVKQDVLEECHKNGGAVHVYVDKASTQGNVYVKCPSVTIAHKSVSALHGRWFSGKVITANYVPVNSYHELFPEAQQMRQPIVPRAQQGAAIPPPPPMAPMNMHGYGHPPAGYPMMPPMNPMMPPPPPSNGYPGYY